MPVRNSRQNRARTEGSLRTPRTIGMIRCPFNCQILQGGNRNVTATAARSAASKAISEACPSPKLTDPEFCPRNNVTSLSALLIQTDLPFGEGQLSRAPISGAATVAAQAGVSCPARCFRLHRCAGVLDGRRVTTHWRYLDFLIKRYKHLQVERDPIFIKDGKFYTTAGVSAGIDLALALVEEDLGHEVAASVARELVLFLRRPGSQAQYSILLAQQATMSDARMRDLPAHAESHLTHKLDVNTLAAFVAMSPRTFARQFEGNFGTTPARWVRSLRVEAARQHLESRNLSLKEIARVTGFRDEQALRRAFVQQMKMTPKEYRERFGVRE